MSTTNRKQENPLSQNQDSKNYSESENYKEWIEQMPAKGPITSDPSKIKNENIDMKLVPEDEKDRRK